MYLQILTQQHLIKVRFMSAQGIARRMTLAVLLETFRGFPPRAKPGSFSLDQALQRMQLPSNN